MKTLLSLKNLIPAIALTMAMISCEKDEPAPVPKNLAPENTIMAPQNNANIDFGQEITITADVSDADGTIESVSFYFDSDNIGTITTAPFTLTFNTTGYQEGAHTIKTKATDNEGAITEVSISVNIIKAAGLEKIEVTQHIDTDQTWLANKIYSVCSNIEINAILTIEPGCIVKVTDYIKVNDNGKIIAHGTIDNPIIFTSKNKNIGGDDTPDNPEIGDWDYIRLASSGSSFDYCIFEYGQKTMKNYSQKLSFSITNCIFRHGFYGFNFEGEPAGDTKIENNRFYSNTYPILISPYYPIGATNSFSSEDGTLKNTYQCICLTVCGFTPSTIEIDEDLTFEETELAYYCTHYIDIKNNSTFTLADNVVLKMGGIGNRNIEIYSGSTFTMNTGSFVTSIHDDTKLGDSDFSTTSPSTNDWYGVKEGSVYKTNMPNVLYSKYSSN